MRRHFVTARPRILGIGRQQQPRLEEGEPGRHHQVIRRQLDPQPLRRLGAVSRAAVAASNADAALDRNFLRHRVLPLLRERIAGRLPTGGVHDLGFELVRRGST